MKFFYAPAWIRCPVCGEALDHPSPIEADGTILGHCRNLSCSQRMKDFEFQLPTIEGEEA